MKKYKYNIPENYDWSQMWKIADNKYLLIDNDNNRLLAIDNQGNVVDEYDDFLQLAEDLYRNKYGK